MTAATSIEAPAPRDRWVAAALRPFADVRPGEATTALLLTVNVFLLLTAYYLLKVAREPLIFNSRAGFSKSLPAWTRISSTALGR